MTVDAYRIDPDKDIPANQGHLNSMHDLSQSDVLERNIENREGEIEKI